MSIDIAIVLEAVAGIIAGAVALLGVYRSLTIAKSLVTRVYRTRAYWLAVLLIVFAAFSLLPTNYAITLQISNLLFFVFLLALLVFIDSNVTVAKELDFFHKDILHWSKVRIPLFAIILIFTAIGVVGTAFSSSSAIANIFIAIYIVVVGVAFSYSGAAMFVIARRTYDRTMKNFVKMLGFAILFWVLFLTLFIPLDAIYPLLGDVVTSFIGIASAYYFYRAAMSLSFVGHIVKEAA